ncbi:hypothetical protein A9K55_006567 [Cordyceps militaris]|uniref:Uncharacterized protein n=1 Tax=Cordyceps militaris TaxID=73501 RepID=A0A2H4SDF7_CORMI|nr:hypothetical protein A9K55_006567 [Cordyceps militaris]
MCGQEYVSRGNLGVTGVYRGSYGQAFERMSAPWCLAPRAPAARRQICQPVPLSHWLVMANATMPAASCCEQTEQAEQTDGPLPIGMQPTTSQPDHPLLTTYIPRHDIHVHVHVDYTDHLPMRPRSPPKLSLSSLHWLLKKGRQPRRTPFPYLVVQHESWLVLVPVHAPA